MYRYNYIISRVSTVFEQCCNIPIIILIQWISFHWSSNKLFNHFWGNAICLFLLESYSNLFNALNLLHVVPTYRDGLRDLYWFPLCFYSAVSFTFWFGNLDISCWLKLNKKSILFVISFKSTIWNCSYGYICALKR